MYSIFIERVQFATQRKFEGLKTKADTKIYGFDTDTGTLSLFFLQNAYTDTSSLCFSQNAFIYLT